MSTTQQSLTKMPWSVAFNIKDNEGHTSALKGKKGDVHKVSVQPHCLYRSDRFLAWDSVGGRGTRVLAVFVGDKQQHLTPARTLFFAVSDKPYENSAPATDAVYGHEVKWDVCEPNQDIAVQVEFLEDCEWEGVSHGQTIL